MLSSKEWKGSVDSLACCRLMGDGVAWMELDPMAVIGGAWAPRNSFKQVSSIEKRRHYLLQQGQEAPALGQICQRPVRTLQDQKQQGGSQRQAGHSAQVHPTSPSRTSDQVPAVWDHPCSEPERRTLE